VRPGLVALGIVLLALGAISVVLVTPYFVGAANTPQASTGQAKPNVAGGFSQLLPINGTDTSNGDFTISWSSADPVNATLYERGSCSSSDYSCILGNVAAHWPIALRGNFSAQGQLAFPYLIVLQNPSFSPIPVTVNWSEHVHDGPFSLLTAVVLLLSVLLLAIIGGLALFLGLFLRGGVYQGPKPVVSQSADDVDVLDADWDEDARPPDRFDEE
jgi:hypothetical protein